MIHEKKIGKGKQETCCTHQARNLLLLWYDISKKYLGPVTMSESFPGQVCELQRPTCNGQKERRKFRSIFPPPLTFKPVFLSLMKRQY